MCVNGNLIDYSNLNVFVCVCVCMCMKISSTYCPSPLSLSLGCSLFLQECVSSFVRGWMNEEQRWKAPTSCKREREGGRRRRKFLWCMHVFEWKGKKRICIIILDISRVFGMWYVSMLNIWYLLSKYIRPENNAADTFSPSSTIFFSQPRSFLSCEQSMMKLTRLKLSKLMPRKYSNHLLVWIYLKLPGISGVAKLCLK